MKIPDNAKKVFEGVIFDVYQWEQKMFDGSMETFERLKRPDTIAVLPISNDKILLADESQPGWESRLIGPVSGRIDRGENPEEAAKRELLEETGYVSDDWELFSTEQPVSKIEWTIHYFIARSCKKTQEPKLDPGEDIKVIEVSFDEFVKLATFSDFRFAGLNSQLLRMIHENKLEDFKKKLNLI